MSTTSANLPGSVNLDFTDETEVKKSNANFYINSTESSSFRARLKRKPHYYFNRLRGLVQSQKISTNSTSTASTSNEMNKSHSSSGSSSTASSPLVVFNNGALKAKYLCDTVVNCDAVNLETAIVAEHNIVSNPSESKPEPSSGVNLISYYSSNFTNSIKARFGTGKSTHFVYKG